MYVSKCHMLTNVRPNHKVTAFCNKVVAGNNLFVISESLLICRLGSNTKNIRLVIPASVCPLCC